MRVAELFFRIGSTLAGWIIVYSHLLMVAVIPRSTCSETNAGLWMPTFITMVLIMAAFVMLPFGLFMRESLRWLAVPAMLLLPLAALAVWPYFGPVTLDGEHACVVLNPDFAPAEVPAWHRFWAPAQFLALAAIGISAWRYWRPRRPAAATPL